MRILHPEDIQPMVRVSNCVDAAPQQTWGPRTILDAELILVARGRFELDRPGRPMVRIARRQVLLIEPGQRHTFRHAAASRNGRIYCIHCELVHGACWGAGDYRLEPQPQQLTDVAGDAVIDELFARGAQVFTGYGRYRRAMVETIVRELWLRLAEKWTASAAPGVSQRMEEMIAFIRSRLSDPITRQDIARRFSLTPQHVNHLFRQALGITPTEFIHRERSLRAYHLMKDAGRSVAQAGLEVGFADPFHFSRIFKRVMGAPPSRI